MGMSNHSAEGRNPSVENSRSEGNPTSIPVISASENLIVEESTGKKKRGLPKASTGGSAGSKGLFVELEVPLAGF